MLSRQFPGLKETKPRPAPPTGGLANEALPGSSTRWCHGGLQAVLLEPMAPTAGLRPPPPPRPARAGSGTQLFAGASAVEWHRVQGGDCGPGTQVRNRVSSVSSHAVSCPACPGSQIPQGRNPAACVSFNLSTPNLRSRFPFPDLKSVSLGLPSFSRWPLPFASSSSS